MSWNPSPGDPHGFWPSSTGYEFCICTTTAGMTDGPEIDLIYRRVGEAPWSPVGPSDGMIYCMGPVSWTADVDAAGGFAAWWQTQVAGINARLLVICPLLGTEAPLQIASPGVDAPPTFEAFQAWLKPHVSWLGPAPPVSGFVSNLALDFGKQRVVLSLAVDANNKATLRAQRWIGPGPDDWQKVPFD